MGCCLARYFEEFRFQTADQVARQCQANLTGKVAIVTGGNQGIGKETARTLAKYGSRVILACRSLKRGDQAKRSIEKSIVKHHNHGTVEVMELNLASLQSIRDFAARFLATERPLHFLVNNAGIMMVPYGQTKDGFELQFGTNHLGPFLLTNLLLDALKRSAPAQVITLSSIMHTGGRINFDRLTHDEQSYDRVAAYSNSKLANVAFALELDRRLAGSGVTSNAVHPGIVSTNLGRSVPCWCCVQCGSVSGLTKTAEEGAATTVYCAVSPEAQGIGGEYFEDCHKSTALKTAYDVEVGRRLWAESACMVGLLPQNSEAGNPHRVDVTDDVG